MRAYKALIGVYLKLAFREKALLFFTYVFPLIFFFTFSQLLGAQGAAMSHVVAMVLVISVLGNGLFGAGIRTVAEREANVLRRYKVAPISPAPILVASMITGWILFMPSLVSTLALAHYFYGMKVPSRLASLLVFVSLGALAMRAVGLIIASVVNTVAESNILVQSLYTPMLFLSGATFPITMLPMWGQIVSQFMPPSYLFSGVQGIVLRDETLLDNIFPAAAMVITTAAGMVLSMKLFRWEKEEKIAGKAKLWVLAVLLPFIVLGIQQGFSRENVAKSKSYEREMRRSRVRLIRGARVIAGDGTVLDRGSVLIRNGRIEQVYQGTGPEPKSIPADAVDAYGKTLLPGLIDAHIHLEAPGGIPAGGPGSKEIDARLAAYLYCGVTAVRSVSATSERLARIQQQIQTGQYIGTELHLGAGGAASVVEHGAVVEHRSFADLAAGIAPDRLAQMAANGISYIPSLGAVEALDHFAKGRAELLDRFLVAQAVPPAMLEATRKALQSPEMQQPRERAGSSGADLAAAKENLMRAHRAGVRLVAGSDAGSTMVMHGPGIQRELQLWVEAGIPAATALRAATAGAARLLGAEKRIGLIRPGHEAILLLVDGNPLQEIGALERIDTVFMKGERIDRSAIFDQK
jgi:imidazolonepropionase-like amidohydrolase/ABC-type multidrug transport system permease subunit